MYFPIYNFLQSPKNVYSVNGLWQFICWNAGVFCSSIRNYYLLSENVINFFSSLSFCRSHTGDRLSQKLFFFSSLWLIFQPPTHLLRLTQFSVDRKSGFPFSFLTPLQPSALAFAFLHLWCCCCFSGRNDTFATSVLYLRSCRNEINPHYQHISSNSEICFQRDDSDGLGYRKIISALLYRWKSVLRTWCMCMAGSLKAKAKATTAKTTNETK